MNLIPVVKKICAKNDDCSYCPFHRNFKCCFGHDEDFSSEYAPCNWSI